MIQRFALVFILFILSTSAQSSFAAETHTPYKPQDLAIGKIAPNFEGKDENGKTISLKNLRGRVVLIDFFGSWCKPCRDMFGHNRALTARYKPEEFTILGIIADPKDVMKSLVKDGSVTWPCIVDGMGGPIATQWGITGYPSLFLLDHKGVIRYRDEIRDDFVMKDALKQLLNEAKTKH